MCGLSFAYWSYMHYFIYLDEFGHIGPFIDRNDPRHNTSPIFGFAGIALPVAEVRKFSTYFYKLKANLLSWEVENMESPVPLYQWEKKGSRLYTVQNIEKYHELRQATFRLMNRLKSIDGFVFYNGIEKEPPSSNHTPEALYFSVLRDCIRRLDKYCHNNGATFSMLLDAVDSDEPGARRKFRLNGISAASSEMFGYHNGYPCKMLLEPPYQLESHLYQNLQCADWFCALIGRRLTYTVQPTTYKDYKIVEDYFGSRLDGILKANSIRKLPTNSELSVSEDISDSEQTHISLP